MTHFEFVHRNVSSKDVNKGILEYAKFEKVGLQNEVNLSHSNIFQPINRPLLICHGMRRRWPHLIR